MSTGIRNAWAGRNIPQLDLKFLLLTGFGVVNLDRDSLTSFPSVGAGAKGARLEGECNQEAWVRRFPWGLFT